MPSCFVANFSAALSGWLERHERALVLCLIVGSSVFVAYVWFPISETSFDDAMFTDPAIRLINGRGFTSAAHFSQGPDTFYASNVPLQQIMLIPWLYTFGLNRLATQAINALYVMLGLAVLMEALRYSRLVKTASMRILFLLLLTASDVTIGLCTLGRPDALCFFIAAVAFAGVVDPKQPRSQLLVAVSSFLAPWASLSLAAMFAFCGVVLLVMIGRPALSKFTAAAIGGAIGVVLLACLYLFTGTANTFLESIKYYGANLGAGDSVSDNFSFRAGGVLRNSFFHVVLAVACLFSALALLSVFKIDRWRLALMWAVMTVFPLYMILVGVFPDYYAWMLSIPSAMLLYASLSTAKGPYAVMSSLAIAAVVMATLAPNSHARKLYWAINNRGLRIQNQQEIARFVADHVRPNDTLIAETVFYYDAISSGAQVYAGWQPKAMTQDDVAKLSLLLLGDKWNGGAGVSVGLDAMREKLGPRWQAVGRAIVVQPYIGGEELTFRAYRQIDDSRIHD